VRGAAEPGNDEGRFLDLYLDSDAEDAEERMRIGRMTLRSRLKESSSRWR